MIGAACLGQLILATRGKNQAWFLYKFLLGILLKKKKNSEKERNHTCFETFKRNHFIWAQIKILFGLFLSETFHAALAHCLGEIVSPRKICLCFLRGDRLDAA